MKKPVDLGKYIVADPNICHGKPTFKGSRVMVWQVLRAVERGESWDEICAAWRGSVTREAIEEALHLAGNVLMEPKAVSTVAKALCHTAVG
jgi:uncharacterized protein (DUF433 family)